MSVSDHMSILVSSQRSYLLLEMLDLSPVWSKQHSEGRRVVRHLGAWSIATTCVIHRTAGGITGVCEPAQVLCMDRLVALQNPDGFVNLKPLPLPAYVKERTRAHGLVLTTGLVLHNDTLLQFMVDDLWPCMSESVWLINHRYRYQCYNAYGMLLL